MNDKNHNCLSDRQNKYRKPESYRNEMNQKVKTTDITKDQNILNNWESPFLY